MTMASIVFRLILCLAVLPASAAAQPSETRYSEVFYPSGSLRIQAYLYKPEGEGPYPVVIYNHGSRSGRERASVPHEYIGRMLTRAGYAVFIPERRGYGKSDGNVWWQEVGRDGFGLIPRLQAETDDVLAALDYLRTVPFADTQRIGIMGWSFGGIVTMLAISRSNAFAAAVNQAGGALTWDTNLHVRSALIAAAEKATTPTLLLVARNDRTTASITSVAGVFKRRGITHRQIIYEPGAPHHGDASIEFGHRLFAAQGTKVWEADVVEFLERHVARDARRSTDAAK
jgi:dienelactone hydrolase